jgi:hypothetical protein
MPTIPEEDDNHWEQERMETVDAGDLRGRTFISNPNWEGEQYCAKVNKVEPTWETTVDQRETLYRFKCSQRGHVFEEIMTYNQMLEWCNRDDDKDDHSRWEAIGGHHKKIREMGSTIC